MKPSGLFILIVVILADLAIIFGAYVLGNADGYDQGVKTGRAEMILQHFNLRHNGIGTRL